MSTPPSPLDLLRLYVNDPNPTDGTLPMFTDAELNLALGAYNQNPKRAAAMVWDWKAARAASLVNVTEGNASRDMSDMHAQFLEMLGRAEKARSGPTDGRTTIGKIRRSFY